MNRSTRFLICWLALIAITHWAGCRKAKPPTVQAKPQPTQATAAVVPKVGEQVSNTPGGGSAGKAVAMIRQSGGRAVALSELQNLALAYTQFRDENNRPPSGVDEIKSSLSPNMVAAISDGSVIVNWKVRDLSSSRIIAHVTVPELSSGLLYAVTGDGKASRISKPELDKLLKNN